MARDDGNVACSLHDLVAGVPWKKSDGDGVGTWVGVARCFDASRRDSLSPVLSSIRHRETGWRRNSVRDHVVRVGASGDVESVRRRRPSRAIRGVLCGGRVLLVKMVQTGAVVSAVQIAHEAHVHVRQQRLQTLLPVGHRLRRHRRVAWWRREAGRRRAVRVELLPVLCGRLLVRLMVLLRVVVVVRRLVQLVV